MFQPAIFFALLNPQPNGAGFVGVYTNTTNMELFSTKTGFKIKVLFFLKIHLLLSFDEKWFKLNRQNKNNWLGHKLQIGLESFPNFHFGVLIKRK